MKRLSPPRRVEFSLKIDEVAAQAGEVFFPLRVFLLGWVVGCRMEWD